MVEGTARCCHCRLFLTVRGMTSQTLQFKTSDPDLRTQILQSTLVFHYISIKTLCYNNMLSESNAVLSVLKQYVTRQKYHDVLSGITSEWQVRPLDLKVKIQLILCKVNLITSHNIITIHFTCILATSVCSVDGMCLWRRHKFTVIYGKTKLKNLKKIV